MPEDNIPTPEQFLSTQKKVKVADNGIPTPEEFLGSGKVFDPTEKTDQMAIKPWKDEEPSYGMEILNALNSGAAALESGILKAPAFVYDVFAAPFNYVLSGELKEDIEGLPRGTYSKDYRPISSEQLGKDIAATAPMAGLSFLEPVAKAPQKIVENLDAITEQHRNEQAQKYGTSISENFANGDYAKGLKLLGTSVAEAVPTTAALMLGSPAGLTTAELTTMGGAVFGAQKKQELDEQFPDMPEKQKVLVSVLNGLSEGYIESSFGLTKLGSEIGAIFKGKGIEAGKEFAKKGFEEVYMPVFKKYAGQYAEEVGSEMVTQYVQNAIDKYVGGQEDKNLMDGVVDAGLIATGMSGPIVGVTGAVELGQVKRGKKAEENYQKQKYQERSEAAFEAVNGGGEAVAILKNNLTQANKNGDLSDNDYQKAMFQIDAYDKFNQQSTDLDLTDEQKKEAFELSFNIEALKSEIPTKKEDVDALDPIAQAKIASKKELMNGLQKQLNDIILKKETEKETKVAEETKAKVAPEEGEEGIDSLLKKYGKTSKGKTQADVEQTLKPTKPAREDLDKIDTKKFNTESEYSAQQKKQVVQEKLKTTPKNELPVTILEGRNQTIIAVLPDGKRLEFAQSKKSDDPNAENYFKYENLTEEDPEGYTDEAGQKLKKYKGTFPIKRVEIDAFEKNEKGQEVPAFDNDGNRKRKAVIVAYNPESGKMLGFIRENSSYKGLYRKTNNYTPKEEAELKKLNDINYLSDEVTPYLYRPPSERPSEKAQEPQKSNVEELGKRRQDIVGEAAAQTGVQRELSPREKELKAAAKPKIELDYIANKEALAKTVPVEVVDSEGDTETTEVSAVKVQKEIRKKMELLKKVLDCVHG